MAAINEKNMDARIVTIYSHIADVEKDLEKIMIPGAITELEKII